MARGGSIHIQNKGRKKKHSGLQQLFCLTLPRSLPMMLSIIDYISSKYGSALRGNGRITAHSTWRQPSTNDPQDHNSSDPQDHNEQWSTRSYAFLILGLLLNENPKKCRVVRWAIVELLAMFEQMGTESWRSNHHSRRSEDTQALWFLQMRLIPSQISYYSWPLSHRPDLRKPVISRQKCSDKVAWALGFSGLGPSRTRSASPPDKRMVKGKPHDCSFLGEIPRRMPILRRKAGKRRAGEGNVAFESQKNERGSSPRRDSPPPPRRMGCCRTVPPCGRLRHRSSLVNPQIPRSCAGPPPLARTILPKCARRWAVRGREAGRPHCPSAVLGMPEGEYGGGAVSALYRIKDTVICRAAATAPATQIKPSTYHPISPANHAQFKGEWLTVERSSSLRAWRCCPQRAVGDWPAPSLSSGLAREWSKEFH